MSNATAALSYLLRRSLVNRLRRQVHQLRQPRNLLALAAGLAYLWLVFLGPQRASVSASFNSWIELLGLAMIVFALVRWWLFDADHAALAFTPAEVQFLFPAPVSRHGLIHLKLVRMQFVLLLNTLLWTVIVRGRFSGLAPWLRAGALYTLFATLSLHRLGVSLLRASVREHGTAGLRRRLVPLAAFGIAGSLLFVGLAASWPSLRAAWPEGPIVFFAAVRAAVERPLPAAVLLPIRWLLRPITATDAAVWGRAMVPALGLMLAHYLWVLRSNDAFEEASIEASVRRANRLAQRRRSGGRALEGMPRLGRFRVRLRPSGWAPLAIVWKNIMSEARGVGFPWVQTLLLLAAVMIIVRLVARGTTGPEAVGALAATWAALLLIAGPQWIRNDLRRDLQQVDVLRTWPLAGPALVGAEVASSALVLTAFQAGLLLLAAAGFAESLAEQYQLGELIGGGGALALVLPPLNYLALAIQNAGALLFPEWVRFDRRAAGVEALGQGVLGMAAAFLLLALAAIGPALLGGGAAWLLWERVAPAVVLPLGGVAAAGGLVLEAFVVTDWLGGVFERFDPSTRLME